MFKKIKYKCFKIQVKWNRNAITIPTTAVVGIVTSIITTMSITSMDIIITTMSMTA